jgi:hypothetical protein
MYGICLVAVLPPHIFIYIYIYIHIFRQCGGDPYSYILLHIYIYSILQIYNIFPHCTFSRVCVIRGPIVTVSYHIIL